MLGSPHSGACALRIRVDPKQTIRINHIQFDATNSLPEPDAGSADCSYSKVRFRDGETGLPSTIDLCKSRQPYNPVFSSSSNLVEMSLVGSHAGNWAARDGAGSLLQFTGNS